MTVDHKEFEVFPQLSARDQAYQRQDKALRPFYTYDFEFDVFKQVIEDRKQFPVDRSLLVEELRKAYHGIRHSDEVAANISLLQQENTFTLITAHQPSLFTGPLYYIIKIASTIHLARKLNQTYNSYQFVPVFILGAEDHDFEEINHTYLFNKKIEWQRAASGSVGRLNLEGLGEALESLKTILGTSENSQDLQAKMDYAFEHAKNYGEFSFLLTQQLFDAYGLVIANFDNKAFKKQFSPIIKREINEQFSKRHIVETQQQLIEAGFSDQAYARDINFFYLSDHKRSRIELIDGTFQILDTDLSFSLEEINQEIDQHPERFSPNVIMRPLYQESIMPNLAYIGGGGELAYWTERKSQFEDAKVFFPMLIRRNSVLWIPARVLKQMQKLALSIEDLTKETDLLVKEFALRESEHDIDFSEAYSNLEGAYAQIVDLTKSIDASLAPKIEAMKANQINGLEKLKGRLIKSIKQKQEVSLNKVRKLQDALFPSGSLQERKTNFMEFYLTNGQQMLDILIEHCDPFEKRFLIIQED